MEERLAKADLYSTLMLMHLIISVVLKYLALRGARRLNDKGLKELSA